MSVKIISVDFPDNQYYKQATKKNQVVLHHTVSNKDKPEGSITWWRETVARVGTHYLISGIGNIYQLIENKYWIHHLGVSSKVIKAMGTTKTNSELNKGAIGIELCSAGPVHFHEGVYRSTFGSKVTDVQGYAQRWRGSDYYEKYTPEQIESTRLLLLDLSEEMDGLCYNSQMWGVSVDALNGRPGIWTHASYRADKRDCHPQPELIDMLKTYF